MFKKSNILKKSEQDNPFILSIGDLMTALMLTFVLLLMGTFLRISKKNNYYFEYEQCNKELQKLSSQSSYLKNYEQCQRELRKFNILNAPQTISLREVEGFTFESGNGILSSDFIINLNKLLKTDRVIKIISNPNTRVIEIIGHTDNEPARKRYSNLDQQVVQVMNGNGSIDDLMYASNTDLGLIRAVSVYLYLRQLQTDGQLRPDLQFRIYSAAQLTLPNGNLVSANDENLRAAQRRRIELKFEALPQAQQ